MRCDDKHYQLALIEFKVFSKVVWQKCIELWTNAKYSDNRRQLNYSIICSIIGVLKLCSDSGSDKSHQTIISQVTHLFRKRLTA